MQSCGIVKEPRLYRSSVCKFDDV